MNEGDKCPDEGCTGTLILERVKDCSCHISSPCNKCEDAGFQCDACREVFRAD